MNTGDLYGTMLVTPMAFYGMFVIWIIVRAYHVGEPPRGKDWVILAIPLVVLALGGWGLWEVGHWPEFTREG